MLVSDFVKIIDRVKFFAKENSVIDLAKNVRIKSDESSVELYCCDGESCIWQTFKQESEQAINGNFCIDAFVLAKLLKSLPPTVEMKLTHSMRNDEVKVSGKSFNLKLKALSVSNVLLIDNHLNWVDMIPGVVDDISLISSMAHTDDRPIAFLPEENLIHHASINAIVYKQLSGDYIEINKFSISPHMSEKFLIDEFNKIDITDRHIHMKNDSCEVMIPQTHIPAIKVQALISNSSILHTQKVTVHGEEIRSVFNTMSKIKEINKLIADGVSLEVNGDEIIFKFYDSDFTVSCINESRIETAIRFSFDMMKALALSKVGKNENVTLFFSETKNDSMLVADKGNGIMFIGGLLK